MRVLSSDGYVQSNRVRDCIWTGLLWRTASLVAHTSKIIRIELSSGHSIDCVSSLKFVIEGEDGYECVYANRLAVGRRICLSMAHPMKFGSELMTRSDAYWMGFAIGNGSRVRRNGIKFTIGTRKDRYHWSDKLIELESYAKSIGLSVQSPDEFENHVSAIVENKSFRQRWITFGYDMQSTAHSKRIPESIWLSNLELRSQFVLGYLDADGCVGVADRTCPSAHTPNRELLAELQILIRTCGVESKLHGPFPSSNTFRLDMNGGHLATHLDYGARERTTCQVRAPRFVTREFIGRIPRWPQGGTSHATLHHRFRSGGTTSVYTLRKMMNEFETMTGEAVSIEMYAAYSIRKITVTDHVESRSVAADHFDYGGFVVCGHPSH